MYARDQSEAISIVRGRGSLGLARGGAHLGERDELPRSSMSHTNPLKMLQTETMVPMVKYDAVVMSLGEPCVG